MNGCYSVGGSVFFLKDGRGGADDDRSRAIAGDRPIDRGRRRAHLRVLRFRDVHEALRRGVDDVEKLRRGRGRRMGTGASVDRRKKRARRGATRPPAAAKRGKYEKRLLARRARDRRFATHLHDRRAVVGDRRHALIVVHELIETARALRIARERRQRDDRGGRGKTSKMARDLAEGGGGGGRASVVRMESTTAMHALMFEMSCPFPWDVSVPSRRSTI